MSLKKTESTQHKLKQTCQLRLWLIVGGVCSLGMGVLIYCRQAILNRMMAVKLS